MNPVNFYAAARHNYDLGHCQTNWPGAEEAIIEDSQGAS